MNVSNYLDDLDRFLNLEDFQQFQDDISKLTGFAIITSDYTGKPVTRHSNCTEFCTMIRRNASFSKLCEKCDARGGLEAARLKKPYIYLCHMGIIDLAVPIVVNNHYLGAIMAGQVFLDDIQSSKGLEKMLFEESRLKILEYNDELRNAYYKLPRYSLEFIVDLSYTILGFIEYKIKTFQKISEYFNSRMTDNTINQQNDDKKVDSRRIHKLPGDVDESLSPAVKYIKENIRGKIEIEKLAELCNYSTGYFSRQFRKKLNCTVPQYVNLVKIEEACSLLEVTDMQINEIAYHLGYEECGYFNKIFKNLKGITPKKYREDFRATIMDI